MVRDLNDVYEQLKKGKSIHDIVSYSSKKTGGKTIRTTLGRVWFNLLLPEDYPFVDKLVDIDTLNNIVKEIADKYGPDKASEVSATISAEAAKLATYVPVSMHFDDLKVPDRVLKEKNELIENINQFDPAEVQSKIEELAKKYAENLEKNNAPTYDLLMAGAKGRLQDLATLTLAKGYAVNVKGELTKPIKHSLLEGLTPEEYYTYAAEGRRSLYARSVLTADPGYLAKKVSYGMSNVVLSETKDCGTKDTFKLKVTESIAPRIIGRAYVDGNKVRVIRDLDEAKKLVGKVIKMRSPIYCKAKDGICQTCYGPGVVERLKTRNIGVLCGGVINMVTLNRLTKAKHVTTQVKIRKVNFKEELKKYA